MSRIRNFLMPFLWLLMPMAGLAQTTQPPTTIEGWADRLTRFGKGIPQEKVFVQMDNTCYFLGDTIWFAAYTRRTDSGLPSNVSRVLYVELLNQDGFLMERQLVEMKNGRGHGNFVLTDTLYAGFYELRAYTRWQLNWGITEKEHTSGAEDWFFNKTMAREYYRDYDKLYSRVFPVYDKPSEAGDFYHDMTTRPLRRYFKSGAPEPQPVLTLFPEGGHLVAGVPCRVAFEAATESGEACEGRTLPPPSLLGREQFPAEGVATINRGRGVFTFTPEAGQDYEFTFTAKDGRTATTKLPKAETDGVALSVERKGDEWEIQVQAVGAATTKPLGLTIMHEGRTLLFQELTGGPSTQIHYAPLLDREGQGGESGIHQATVFDDEGRVWADRLFFVTKPDLQHSSLTISGLKEEYAPFEQVSLQLTAPFLKSPSPLGEGLGVRSAGGESVLSLSVRDAATLDYTYDTSNILTEMLLASELKGFIPDPAYFFEADDDVHRTALDLLMMTQGWRRFDWRTMAVPGAFVLSQPAESQTPVLRGEVLNFEEKQWQDDLQPIGDKPTPFFLEDTLAKMHPSPDDDRPAYTLRKSITTTNESLSIQDEYTNYGLGEFIETILAQTYAHESNYPPGSYRMQGTIATSRFNAKENALKREMRVHAEFAQPGSKESVLGDMDTKNGHFTIPSPYFQGYCIFFLAASDTTKWKKGKTHAWISMEETDAPEFYVRISWPYPRFTQPYSYYQMGYRPAPQNLPQTSLFNPKTFETDMQTVVVRARRGGMRKLDLTKPAFKVDAYEAFNDACDAGLMEGRYYGRYHYLNSVARLYAGDMQTNSFYLLEPRFDGRNLSVNRSAQVMNRYNMLTNLDSVALYTDYNPRTGGDPRAKEDNVERLAINLQQMPDEGQRVVYRDRRYVLQGFNVADDFYHPDYQLTPPADGHKDYRRTLYWNPDLKLDADGTATVRFFMGSKASSLSIDANGQTADGTLITSP